MARAGAALTKLAAVIFICMVTMVPRGSAVQLSCNDVAARMSPCLPYIRNGAPTPGRGSQCCLGVRFLAKVAKGRTARKGICICLNRINILFTNAQIRNAARLPGLCRTSIPITIKRNIDCSRV